jgi:agmatine deiminase
VQVRADWQLTGPLLALWPFRQDVWPQQGRPAQQQLLQLLQAIQPHHPVLLAVPPRLYATVRHQVGAEIPLIMLPYNDAWPRDFGPLWLQHKLSARTRALQFDFHAWQGLYPDYQADQRFTGALTRLLCCPLSKQTLVLEGGAITTNGDGVAIVNAVSVQRNNPAMRLSQIRAQLTKHLGLRHIFWLHEAHPADETGGHIDNQIQFVDSHTLVHAIAPDLLAPLQQQFALAGLHYRWLAVPLAQTVPPNAHEFHSVSRRNGVLVRGQRPLLASYVNFIRVADALLLPQFGLPSDRPTLTILRQQLPQLRVIGVAADEFIKAGGGPHCVTLNIPSTGALTAWMNNSNKP